MLLRIQGKEYDATEALARPTLNDVFYMQMKSVSEVHPKGVSLKKLGGILERMEDVDEDDFLEDAEIVLGLRCMIFLARRKAGEKITIDEANDFPLSELEIVMEDSDAIAAEDPLQPPADSDPVDDRPAAGAKNSRKTSAPKSPSGSRSSRKSTPA